MTAKTFTTFANRRDASLTGFSSDDNAALLAAICGNATTGYVRQLKEGGPVSVPNHAAEAVKADLISKGWTAR